MLKPYTFLLFAVLLLALTANAQVSYTANDINPPYTGKFRPGINLSYLPPWNSFQLGDLAAGNPALGIPGVGARSTRPGLFDEVLDVYGYGLNVAAFDYYRDLGMEELTAIVGFPSDANRDWDNSFCSDPDKFNAHFKGIYEPIWDDGSDGTPYNEDNLYATYLYQVVSLYTDNVRFWEIWNEPGLYKGNDGQVFWGEPDYPGSWWMNDPDPCDYVMHAPIEHFVRVLRISYEVIKTLSPDDYVSVAGVGSQSFLDAILRNTDNPDDGSVTADYPNYGGAYIDVLGFHTYPHLDGSTAFSPDNYFERHSDGAADGLINRRLAGYQQVLYNHGYDGVTYPLKQHICTEINVPRRIFSGNYFGGEVEQLNFISKALIALKVNGVHQMHVYSISDKVEEQAAGFEFDLMGLYKKLESTQPYSQELNAEGVAYKTAADLIYPTEYDEAQALQLDIPDGVRAYAFAKPDGTYLYALWAETREDLSEAAAKTYAFPPALGLDSVTVYRWDHSQTQSTETLASTGLVLDASPIFVEAAAGSPVLNEAPVPTLSTASTSVAGDFDVAIDWSEVTTGLATSDLLVSNGRAYSLVGNGTQYSFRVAPAAAGPVSITVPVGAAVDLEGLDNLASNVLTVSASQAGTGPGNGSDADLELSMVANRDTLGQFEEVEFTLVATNAGGRHATDVIVEFPLPYNLSFVKDSLTQGQYSSFFGNWMVGDLAGGESATLTATLFSIKDSIGTAFAQVIAMTQYDPDSKPGNGSCCVVLEDDEALVVLNGVAPPTIEADLSLGLSSEQQTVADDGAIEVTYTVRNDGPNATAGVVVDVTLPPGLLVEGSTIPNGTQLNGSRWAVNRLNLNEERELTLQLRASDPRRQVALIAEVAASMQNDPDSAPANGVAGEDDRAILVLAGAPVAMSDLELTLTADKSAYRKYQPLTISIEVVNAGRLEAQNIVVGYPELAGTIFLNSSASVGNYSRNAADWNLGSLASGERATLTVSHFPLTNTSALTAFAQVLQADAQDSDSSPNNRVCCIAVEDDEGALTLNPDTTPPIVLVPGGYPTLPEIANDVIVDFNKPVGGQIGQLSFVTTAARVDAVLVDGLGRFLQHVPLASAPGKYQEEIDFSGLLSGTYTLVIATPASQQAIRVVHSH